MDSGILIDTSRRLLELPQASSPNQKRMPYPGRQAASIPPMYHMQGKNVETELRQHLIAQGMMFGAPTLIEKRLRSLMKKTRYVQYLDACDAYRAGSVPIDTLYEHMKTLDEANALMSHQAQATLEIGVALYESGEPYISTGMWACELGCYTGGFTSWLAERHPGCTMVGVDRQEHLLAIASKASSLPNLVYRSWDYTHPPMVSEEFDILFSCFGIDLDSCSRSVHHSLDPYDRRSGQVYKRVRTIADRILANWRAAAKPSGRLFAALRIPNYDTCLAIIESARAAGWACSYGDSSTVRAEDEAFRLLCFTASSCGQDSNEDETLLWWLHSGSDSTNVLLLPDERGSGKYLDSQALLHFRQLKDRRVRLDQSRTYDDMHTMRLECGTTGDRFYRFKIATTGYCDLNSARQRTFRVSDR